MERKVDSRYPSRAALLEALRCGQDGCPINSQLHAGSRTANVTLHPWTHDPLRQPTASSFIVDGIRTYCPKCSRFNPVTFVAVVVFNFAFEKSMASKASRVADLR